jgi:hypothetical protein
MSERRDCQVPGLGQSSLSAEQTFSSEPGDPAFLFLKSECLFNFCTLSTSLSALVQVLPQYHYYGEVPLDSELSFKAQPQWMLSKGTTPRGG